MSSSYNVGYINGRPMFGPERPPKSEQKRKRVSFHEPGDEPTMDQDLTSTPTVPNDELPLYERLIPNLVEIIFEPNREQWMLKDHQAPHNLLLKFWDVNIMYGEKRPVEPQQSLTIMLPSQDQELYAHLSKECPTLKRMRIIIRLKDRVNTTPIMADLNFFLSELKPFKSTCQFSIGIDFTARTFDVAVPDPVAEADYMQSVHEIVMGMLKTHLSPALPGPPDARPNPEILRDFANMWGYGSRAVIISWVPPFVPAGLRQKSIQGHEAAQILENVSSMTGMMTQSQSQSQQQARGKTPPTPQR